MGLEKEKGNDFLYLYCRSWDLTCRRLVEKLESVLVASDREGAEEVEEG
jgi:hypothetical protein